MKILILGTGKLDCAAANCGIALRAMGHEVRHFDPDEHPRVLARVRRSWEGKRIVNRVLSFAVDQGRLWEPALLREVDTWGPDLVLVIPITMVSPATINAIKRSGARVAGWFQDAIVNFGAHTFLVADSDALFFKDEYTVRRLREGAGLQHVHWLPEACEPRVHHPLPLSEEDRRRFGCDLMIYGNPYPYRLRLLEGLADMDLRMYGNGPVRFYGHRLERNWQGEDLYWDRKIKAVLAAKIVVNTSHYGEIESVNARTFEVAGIGGFQVADAPKVADFFKPGEEIVTFCGPKELRERIEHYLQRPEERRAIAERARERAHREHTYEKRLAKLLEVVGLS